MYSCFQPFLLIKLLKFKWRLNLHHSTSKLLLRNSISWQFSSWTWKTKESFRLERSPIAKTCRRWTYRATWSSLLPASRTALTWNIWIWVTTESRAQTPSKHVPNCLSLSFKATRSLSSNHFRTWQLSKSSIFKSSHLTAKTRSALRLVTRRKSMRSFKGSKALTGIVSLLWWTLICRRHSSRRLRTKASITSPT